MGLVEEKKKRRSRGACGEEAQVGESAEEAELVDDVMLEIGVVDGMVGRGGEQWWREYSRRPCRAERKLVVRDIGVERVVMF